jgi:hypothetical protein
LYAGDESCKIIKKENMRRIIDRFLGNILYSKFLGLTLIVSRYTITKLFDVFDFEKYRIQYNKKVGHYDIYYKFSRWDKFRLLKWSDGERMNFFDSLGEEEIASFLFYTKREDFLNILDYPCDGEAEMEYLMNLLEKAEELSKNFNYGIFLSVPTRKRYTIMRHEKYFKFFRDEEREFQRMYEYELAREIEKDINFHKNYGVGKEN